MIIELSSKTFFRQGESQSLIAGLIITFGRAVYIACTTSMKPRNTVSVAPEFARVRTCLRDIFRTDNPILFFFLLQLRKRMCFFLLGGGCWLAWSQRSWEKATKFEKNTTFYPNMV